LKRQSHMNDDKDNSHTKDTTPVGVLASYLSKFDWDKITKFGLIALGIIFAPMVLCLLWFVFLALVEFMVGCSYPGGGMPPQCEPAFGVLSVDAIMVTSLWAGTVFDFAFYWAEFVSTLVALYIGYKLLRWVMRD